MHMAVKRPYFRSSVFSSMFSCFPPFSVSCLPFRPLRHIVAAFHRKSKPYFRFSLPVRMDIARKASEKLLRF
jgi:hypothetical protein